VPPVDAARPTASSVAEGDTPYRAEVMQQYWTFAPSGVHYAHHGALRVLRDDPPPVQVIAIPSWPSSHPHHLATSSTSRLVSLQEISGQARSGWVMLGVVMRPSRKLKKNDLWLYDITWQQDRVPYLHDESGGSRRLLSYSATAFPDQPKTHYVYAIPADSTDIHLSDFQPFRELDPAGWKIYEYDATGRAVITIHLGFDYGKAPSTAPPSPGDIFRALPH
jgi:hypothetical protein